MSARLRLSIAFAASVLLHAALLAGRMPQFKPPIPARLEVKLPPPVETIKVTAPDDPELLEKNTLSKAEKPLPEAIQAPPPPPKPDQAPRPRRLSEQQEQHALRKFSEYIIYPQAAIDAGREGTTHLLLSLRPDGTVTGASIAASSGHRDLDEAALAAVHRVGRINVGGKTEFILPFTFRLQ